MDQQYDRELEGESLSHRESNSSEAVSVKTANKKLRRSWPPHFLTPNTLWYMEKKKIERARISTIEVEELACYLTKLDYDEIDKRSAVNKNIKARVMVIRPKWLKWEAGFDMVFDNETLTQETITELITTTGNYVGIGSYRPSHNGYFGRFKLIDLNKKD